MALSFQGSALVPLALSSLLIFSGSAEGQSAPPSGLAPALDPPLASDLSCNAQRPDLAALSGGGFAAAWSNGNIAARVFSPSGEPLGLDFQVNETGGGFQDSARVAALPNGGFVVAWIGVDSGQVRARLYDGAGQPTSPQLSLSPTLADAGAHLSLTASPDGSFWVAWEDQGSVLAVRANGEGTVLASLIVPGDTGFSLRDSPDVAVDSQGHLLLAWQERGGGLADPPGPARILVQRHDEDGLPLGSAVEVLPPGVFVGSEVFGLSVAASPSGGWVVSYIAGFDGRVYLRRFGVAGAPLEGFSIVVGPAGLPRRQPVADGTDVVVLPDGRIAVAWDELPGPEISGDALPADIRLRILEPGSSVLGPIVQVNQARDKAQRAPRFALLASGRLAVAWWTELPFPPILPPDCFRSDGVFARLLDLPSAPDSPELCLGDDKRFCVEVAWQDPFNGGSGDGKAVLLTPDTGAFWFFNPENLELMLKLLDGRSINGHYWFFYGALSNVGYQITVTDRNTGATRVYENAPGQFASFADTQAFPELDPPP